ncbi:MAG TPA: CHAT domain-containing protein [Thermoanaerobaculia bacterium]|nr:CHAT domain-containing protein [Thermoanaerobaculia bacterium]
MPRVEYQRIDLPVGITLDAVGGVVLRLGGEPAARVEGFGPAWLQRVEAAGADFARLFRGLPPAAFVERPAPPRPAITTETVRRVALDVRGSELAAIDWEDLLAAATREIPPQGAGGHAAWTIVRTCAVRPRSSTLPLTLPLRILQVDPRPAHPLPAWVRSLFGHRPQEEVDRAVMVGATPQWRLPAGWPKVDVLHLDAPPPLDGGGPAPSTALPEMPGTLGWLARLTDRWRTRLVVMHCETAPAAAAARRLAGALCDRGGPAVLAVLAPAADAGAADFYRAFYFHLVHDFPLDDILAQTVRFDRRGGGVTAALFAGAGREDALRVSAVGLVLANLSRTLDEKTAPPAALAADRAFSAAVLADPAVREVLASIKEDWESSRFNLHEREGLLPLAANLAEIRRISERRATSGRMRRGPTSPRSAPAPGPRFVSSGLWRGAGDELEPIAQDVPALTAGELVHLAITIGPQDVRIRTLDATAIVEDAFTWSPERDGVWVDLAVAGIDFGVAGDSVQEVWLPRVGTSEPVHFAVRPCQPGVAMLRFGLYYKNDLIQSFRLAAKVREVGDGVVPTAAELAKALAVAVSRVGVAGYLARLEYSRTSNLDSLDARRGRALTIVANDLEDREVLTIKGPDVHCTTVRPDRDMQYIVTALRRTLDEIAFVTIQGLEQPQYQFLGGPQEVEQRCREAISRLAAAGWNLFLNLAPTKTLQDNVRRLLQDELKTIHVAQILREKVIPWAFVYDRRYDAKVSQLDGQPVEQGVCLAAVPRAGTRFGALRCGEHAECLLNEHVQAERRARGNRPYAEATVACPLHFWGFRHILEVPPGQQEDGEKTHDEQPPVERRGAPQLAAGLNATLLLTPSHWKDLSQTAAWIDPEYDRDRILDLLRRKEPDLIYFYCHAHGGQVDPERTYPPYLEFQAAGADPGRIEPQDFGGEKPWSHAPLVFLNACGTLGYSPDALSPFLKVLVDGRQASGVLGTEVPVAEALAGKFAHEFMTRFMAGITAGQAVVEARRVLLAQNNPLGLVYTLFAPADLKIK